MCTDFAKHLNQELSEFIIDGGEISLALMDGERRKPFKDGGPGIGIRIKIWRKTARMVERDVSSERVDELVLSHERVGESVERGWFVR